MSIKKIIAPPVKVSLSFFLVLVWSAILSLSLLSTVNTASASHISGSDVTVLCYYPSQRLYFTLTSRDPVLIANDNTYLNRSCAGEGRDGAQSVSQIPRSSPIHSRTTQYQPSPTELQALGVSQSQIDGSVNAETGGSDEEIVDGNGNPVGNPEDAAGADTETCETNGGEFSFGVCPLLRLANDGVQAFDTQIRARLQVDPGFYADDSPLRAIWARIRNIAYVMLIPVVLLLVIGTALGYGFIDAYTVKRAMPRLLFAVIFMALSYDIGGIMIDLSNVATKGVQGLISSAIPPGPNCPGGGANCLTLSNLFNPAEGPAGAAGGALLAGGFVGGALLYGAGALSISILLSFLASALLWLIIVFTILLIRQLVIVLILAILPLAILTWIFPGNDKFWKVTWNTFTGLLIAGPIFSGFAVFGWVLAYIINVTTDQSNLGPLAFVMIVGGKLILIALAEVGGIFLMARFGGAAGNVLGMVNDRGKGLFDRNKQLRANIRKGRLERSKEGALSRGGLSRAMLGQKYGTKLTKAVNRRSQLLTTAPDRFNEHGFAMFKKAAKTADDERRLLETSAAVLENKKLDPLKNWDNGSTVAADILLDIRDGELKNTTEAIRERFRKELFDGKSDEELKKSGDLEDLDLVTTRLQSARREYMDDDALALGLHRAAVRGGFTQYYGLDEAGGKLAEVEARLAGGSTTVLSNISGFIRDDLKAGGRSSVAGQTFGEHLGTSQKAEEYLEYNAKNAGKTDEFGEVMKVGRLTQNQLKEISETKRMQTLTNKGATVVLDASAKKKDTDNAILGVKQMLMQSNSDLMLDGTTRKKIVYDSAGKEVKNADGTTKMVDLTREEIAAQRNVEKQRALAMVGGLRNYLATTDPERAAKFETEILLSADPKLVSTDAATGQLQTVMDQFRDAVNNPAANPTFHAIAKEYRMEETDPAKIALQQAQAGRGPDNTQPPPGQIQTL